TAASSHAIPLPGSSLGSATPSLIFNRVASTASAQSTYSSQCAVGVTQSKCALTSENTWVDISMPAACANDAARSQPVTPPMRCTSGITKSQASAESADCIEKALSK